MVNGQNKSMRHAPKVIQHYVKVCGEKVKIKLPIGTKDFICQKLWSDGWLVR